MSDLEVIAISKTVNVSFFDMKKFQKVKFLENNHHKPIFSKILQKKSRKNLEKFCVEKMFHCAWVSKIIFHKMISSKIDPWQLEYDFWPTLKAHSSVWYYQNETFYTLKRYFSSRSLTSNQERLNLMLHLGDITILETVNFLPTDMNQFSKIKFFEKYHLKIIFFWK